MHTNNRPLRAILITAILFAFVVCLAFIASTPAHAQAAADQSSAVATAALDTAAVVAQPFIVELAHKYPWLLTALAAIASLRLVFKPIMSAAGAYVRSTASTRDDEFVARVEHSKAFKAFAWLLDYLGSIKVGPQKKAQG